MAVIGYLSLLLNQHIGYEMYDEITGLYFMASLTLVYFFNKSTNSL